MSQQPKPVAAEVPPTRSPVRIAATLSACALLALALLGFVPVVTTDLSQLSVAGPGSQAYLFGIIQVSVLHNLVHGVIGALGLTAADRPIGARGFLFAAGFAYLLLWGYGLAVAEHSPANLLGVDAAGTALHAVLALAFLILGLLLGRDTGMGTGSNTMAR